MKTVVIDKKDISLTLQNSAIKIDEQSIPLRLIDFLILNHRAILNTSDILKITKEGISILLISYTNDNFSLITSANTKNAQTKLYQYNSLKRNLEFAKYFISKKIDLYVKHLYNHNILLDQTKEQQNIKNAKSLDKILGIEGLFAKKYFQKYFSLLPKSMHKSKRSKQPPLDPVNAVLSFWYSLYYNIITAKLISYGFEPSLGYLHTPFRTHNALSSDILELFRADINEAVINLFKKRVLNKDDFTKNRGVFLKYSGRKKIWSDFLALVDSLKPKLDAEIGYLKRRIYEEKSCCD